MPEIKQLYTYPIKALPGIALHSAHVDAGARMPGDRRYAIAPAKLNFDPRQPRHVSKQELHVLMTLDELAQIDLSVDDEGHFTLASRTNNDHEVCANPDSADGRAAIESFLSEALVDAVETPVKLISATEHGFTDLADRSVSIVNLASVRALAQATGIDIDPRRFRANLYIDGAPPWEEFNWMDRKLTCGAVEMQVYRITDRCAAINVDPVTAQRDRLLQQLKHSMGHVDMGVYAMITQSGQLTVGTALSVN